MEEYSSGGTHVKSDSRRRAPASSLHRSFLFDRGDEKEIVSPAPGWSAIRKLRLDWPPTSEWAVMRPRCEPQPSDAWQWTLRVTPTKMLSYENSSQAVW